MVSIQPKIIEVLAVRQTRLLSYIKISWSIGNEHKIYYWEVDRKTATDLNRLINEQHTYKYRLSFSYHEGQTSEGYKAFLYRTEKSNSYPCIFACSEKFVEQLNTLKQIESFPSIEAVNFLVNDRMELIQGTKKALYRLGLISFAKKEPRQIFMPISAAVVLVLLLTFFINPMKNSQAIDSDSPEIFDTEMIAKSKMKTFAISETTPNRYNQSKDYQKSTPVISTADSIVYDLPAGYVALTFDDGPSQYTEQIADILKEHRVGGTFFFVGQHIKDQEQAVKYVYDNGFSIGSHSHTHRHLPTMTAQGQAEDLNKATDIIEKIIDDKIDLFRPPYGAFNSQTEKHVKSLDQKTILWNIDTLDWKKRNPQQIIDSIKYEKISGSIILMHENENIVASLPEIIDLIQQQGLQIVSLK